MQRHPLFDIALHDDQELAAVVGSPVVRRLTLHEWPLSCVQGVEFASGERFIYKAQRPPTVEPEFYQRAQSPLLVKARVVPSDAGPAALLLDEIRAPRLADVKLTASQALSITEQLLREIQQIRGDLPALDDLRARDSWSRTAADIVDNLRALAELKAVGALSAEVVERVAASGCTPAVLAALDSPQGYVHFNLTSTNVLLAKDGYRLIDWQRPIVGPVALDRASLLESMGLDPRPHVLPGVLQLSCLLTIGWYAQCARFWFPKALPWLASEIVRLAGRLEPNPPRWTPIVTRLEKVEPTTTSVAAPDQSASP